MTDKDHHHHEALTETQLGTVHFPISCAASVQKPFARGVALLHSFWYEEAEKEFLDIAKDDPKCAMAHWGIAMSIWHQLWNEPDAKGHRARSGRSEGGRGAGSEDRSAKKLTLRRSVLSISDSQARPCTLAPKLIPTR